MAAFLFSNQQQHVQISSQARERTAAGAHEIGRRSRATRSSPPVFCAGGGTNNRYMRKRLVTSTRLSSYRFSLTSCLRCNNTCTSSALDELGFFCCISANYISRNRAISVHSSDFEEIGGSELTSRRAISTSSLSFSRSRIFSYTQERNFAISNCHLKVIKTGINSYLELLQLGLLRRSLDSGLGVKRALQVTTTNFHITCQPNSSRITLQRG